MSTDDERPNVVMMGRAKPATAQATKGRPATLTLIDTPRFGAALFGTIDCPEEHIHKLIRQLGITRRHIAEGGCRGPRPSEP